MQDNAVVFRNELEKEIHLEDSMKRELERRHNNFMAKLDKLIMHHLATFKKDLDQSDEDFSPERSRNLLLNVKSNSALSMYTETGAGGR